MIAALRYEWLRIRTIRSTYWITAIAVVIGIGFTTLAAWGTSYGFGHGDQPVGDDLDLLGPGLVSQFSVFGAPYFVVYIAAMIGVFAWGHEYRHGMVRATLTALPSREFAWVAKFLVVAAWIIAVVLATAGLSLAISWLFLNDNGVEIFTPEVGRTTLALVVYSVIFTWLAAAVTALLRNQTAALVFMFLWPLAVEPLVSLIVGLVPALDRIAPATRFLPFEAGQRIIDQVQDGVSVFGEPMTALGGVVVFGGLTAVAMAASLALFQRRDA